MVMVWLVKEIKDIKNLVKNIKFKDEPNIWYKYVRWDNNPHTGKVEFGQGDNGEKGKHTELK
jgi:hypothetical protein